jgi:hypothetical protein
VRSRDCELDLNEWEMQQRVWSEITTRRQQMLLTMLPINRSSRGGFQDATGVAGIKRLTDLNNRIYANVPNIQNPLDRIGRWGKSRSVKRISIKASSGCGEDSACSFPAECELCSGCNDYAERAVCAAEVARWRIDSGCAHRMVSRRNVLTAVTRQACCHAATCAGRSPSDRNTTGWQLLSEQSFRVGWRFPQDVVGNR